MCTSRVLTALRNLEKVWNLKVAALCIEIEFDSGFGQKVGLAKGNSYLENNLELFGTLLHMNNENSA